ncbi:MAG TPA: O-antigen polymerase [Terriglobia bacterium]|nr:O-antigen polymerase [Terriglobia bacterium]
MGSTAIDARPARRRSFSGLHLLLLIGLALGGTALLISVLAQGVARNDLEIFLALLTLYAVLTVVFLVSQIRGGHFPFFDLPVFLTVVAFVRYGLLPLPVYLNTNLLDNYFRSADYPQLNRTFFLLLLGMVAFWAGCRLCRQASVETVSADPISSESKSEVALGWAVGLFIMGMGMKVYVMRTYGWGYAVTPEVLFAHLATLQTLMAVADMSMFALGLMAVEICFHPHSSIRKVLFAIFFAAEVFWGALSGMKGNVFRCFILVAVIVSIAKAKVEKKWIAAVLLGIVLVYPMQTRYRSMLRGGEVDTRKVGALENAGSTAAQEAAQEESGWTGWLESGWALTVGRLDLLQAMAISVSLDPWQVSRVQGDERWWMVPFYPFVPRFIWRDKPILNRGQKLSILLGAGSGTSTTLTYTGDLYMDFGLPGLLVGMCALGLFSQWITNLIVRRPGKRELFLYGNFFLIAANLYEGDWFLVWVSLLKWIVLLTILAYLIYGFNRGRPEQQPSTLTKEGMAPAVPE